MTELHNTTAAALEAIKTFWAEKGYSPSIRDIVDATGISSTSVVHYHIVKLERLGLIERTPGVARSYVLIEDGRKGESMLHYLTKEEIMDRCENCGEEQRSVMLRPNDKRLCADCNQERLIAMDPTNLVVRRLARFNGKI